MQKLRKPKVGDVWQCDTGAVLVIGRYDDQVDYLWQDTPDRFEFDGTSLHKWHKLFDFKENIFDCEDIKLVLPQDHQEIKAQQRRFERLASKKSKQPTHDPIHHPSHYNRHPNGIECIQVTEHMNFCLGNAIKYIWRAGSKDGNSKQQDLQKALWYIQREITRLKNAR